MIRGRTSLKPDWHAPRIITLRDQTVISKINVILTNDNMLQLSLHNIHT